MATISKSNVAQTDSWKAVDEGFAAVTMKRKFSTRVLYFIGPEQPSNDNDNGVQTWEAGAVTVRDLDGSHIWVKALDANNPIDLILSSATVLAVLAEGIATEAKQAMAIARLDSILSSVDGLEGGLASILGKLIAAPSTAQGQADIVASLATLAAAAPSDPATQTTLTAVLAKLPAGGATATLQGAGNAALAAILDKIIDAPATAQGQSDLGTLLTQLKTQIVLAAGAAVIGKVGLQVAGADLSAINPAPVNSTDRVLSVLGSVLTRPANTIAYAAGDAISDNATAASVTAITATVSDLNDAPIVITEIELDTNDAGLAAGTQVDIYVYNQDPTANSGVGGGDNAAFANKRAGFRARFRGTFLAFSDGGKAICVPVDGNNSSLAVAPILPENGGKRLWLQYKTVAAFTPSAPSTLLTPRIKGFQSRA